MKGTLKNEEEHFLFQCQAIDSLRTKYGDLFATVGTEDVAAFMAQNQTRVARFLRECQYMFPGQQAAAEASTRGNSNCSRAPCG